MGWTKDQEKAIYTDTGSGNLLVSAAAGSGKTAVLVERILQKILSGKSTIDRLLVVTFTEAAASEMRQKIIKRLFEYLKDTNCTEAEKKLIKSQIHLTQTADIMTIDGFCNRVVTNNFHALGIDPNIRICDDAMAHMLVSEALEKLFNDIYKSDDAETKSRFKRLTDFYAKDRSNDRLKDLILSVYRFTESFADPQQWLRDAVACYDLPVFEQPTVKYHMDYTKDMALRTMQELELVVSDDESVMRTKEYIYTITVAIYEASDWDDIYNIYEDKFSKPKKLVDFMSMEGISIDCRLEYAARLLCDTFTSGKLGKTAMGITQSKDEVLRTHNSERLKAEAMDIAWIVSEFAKRLDVVKEKRNLYEFSDIEHLTYKLFNENETIRCEYTEKYDEILIDEYQDTNMLQDTIFGLISHNNIFMVGDLKQSIYRFRKGDPYIFKEKSGEYEQTDNEHNRVTLSQNFRSRQEVLASVNNVFTMIMSEGAGDVDYSGDEQIVRDADFEYYPETDTDNISELHYLALSTEAEIEREVCEARYTALKIKELLLSGTEVFDKSTGGMRPIQKKDIVILENSVKYNADIITDELSRLGIDSYIDRSEFFDRREISVMLSLISVIDNSHDDVPLISVMRSPIGGFTDDELAKIRICGKDCRYFIDAVLEYGKNGEDKQLSARCFGLLSDIRRWRDYVRKKSVAQLIWTIYEETCFYDFMGALENGEESQTNLRLLYERAKQFESAGFKGLFNFIKYVNQLKESNADLEGAKLVGETHDVVRIMTIHKSKGLEFPFVFLLGAGRDFPVSQDFSSIRMHKTLGFGLQDINYDEHYARKTHSYELISQINKIESISERMRLLYVALTRPREKLFVIVARNHKPDTTIDDITKPWSGIASGAKLLPTDVLGAKGFYSWLCPTAYVSDGWRFFVKRIETTIDTDIEQSESESETYDDSKELHDTVYRLLDYKYPYSDTYSVPTRTSVTQLKERSMEIEYEPQSRQSSGDDMQLTWSYLHSKPGFMLDADEKPANEIGTLYHLVMAQIDIVKISNDGIEAVDMELDRLVSEKIITNEDIKYIDRDKIKAFFETDIAKRMLKSVNIYRERSFQINISACDYDPNLSEQCKDNTVILQGIIDCFFEEADGYVLFDYKTDKVKSGANAIKERYKKQLELYTRAIETLTNKPVKESYLYLFDTNETV